MRRISIEDSTFCNEIILTCSLQGSRTPYNCLAIIWQCHHGKISLNFNFFLFLHQIHRFNFFLFFGFFPRPGRNVNIIADRFLRNYEIYQKVLTKAKLAHKLGKEGQSLVTLFLLAGWGAIFEKGCSKIQYMSFLKQRT